MEPYRSRFEKWALRVVGGYAVGATATGASAGGTGAAGTLLWIGMVGTAVVASSVIWWQIPQVYAQPILAALWGLFIGGALVVYVKPKVLTSIAGAVAGAGISNINDVPGLIGSIRDAIERTTAEMPPDFSLQPISLWIFLCLIMICCLPAFGRD